MTKLPTRLQDTLTMHDPLEALDLALERDLPGLLATALNASAHGPDLAAGLRACAELADQIAKQRAEEILP